MKTSTRVAVVLVLLVATALYVRLNPPRRLTLGPEALTAFPVEFDSWRGADLEFSDVVTEELAADETLARRYVDDQGNSVWFIIIFHQNERYGAHEPVVCYRAQGWSVVDQGLTSLSRQGGGFDANWLLIETRGQKRVALYWWYTAGDLATADRDKFMARMATAGVRSNVTFGAFIRVSVAVGEGASIRLSRPRASLRRKRSRTYPSSSPKARSPGARIMLQPRGRDSMPRRANGSGDFSGRVRWAWSNSSTHFSGAGRKCSGRSAGERLWRLSSSTRASRL